MATRVLGSYPDMLDRLAGQLERYMDLLSARQKLVASNIANADTPGYHTRDIDFQSEFQNAAGGEPRILEAARTRSVKMTETTSVWTANRGCWRRTRCASNGVEPDAVADSRRPVGH